MPIQPLFDKFSHMKALIIGDVMVDSYIWGKVTRISPEAPVPIVHTRRSEKRLGGAANVARNVLALGATPILCSVVGDDDGCRDFEKLLSDSGMTNKAIVKSADRITTVKHRILAGSQQLLRLDSEIDSPISQAESNALMEKVRAYMPECQVVIFEDYDKGVLTEPLIREIIAMATRQGIPTVVDPKRRNFFAYENCSLFKPNLKELREALGVAEYDGANTDETKRLVRSLRSRVAFHSIMVTLSEHGVYISDFKDEHHIPAHRREIADVSGAGDTVVSIAALCLAAGLPMSRVAGLANLGGGLVCEYLGVVPIDKDRLIKEAERVYGLA